MTEAQYLKNLSVPTGKVDVILDTDAYNEIDDQFAISYLIRNTQKLNVKGLCAAPFYNLNSSSAKDGMEKSYNEIIKLLDLAKRQDLKKVVFKGSGDFLKNETTPEESDAADFMAELSNSYSPENPLYIVAIGAITNVASAILKNPLMKENCVIVWLGGHGIHMPCGASEFNMAQDIAAARIVFGCGIPLVQLPCGGVVDHFTITKPELLFWMTDKNELCDYLRDNSIAVIDTHTTLKPWSRVIWDVTAVAWLLNDNSKFMKSRLINSPIPEYDKHYAFNPNNHFIRYIYSINRDELFGDLFDVLGERL